MIIIVIMQVNVAAIPDPWYNGRLFRSPSKKGQCQERGFAVGAGFIYVPTTSKFMSHRQSYSQNGSKKTRHSVHLTRDVCTTRTCKEKPGFVPFLILGALLSGVAVTSLVLLGENHHYILLLAGLSVGKNISCVMG